MQSPGMRILDLSNLLPGPLCGSLLLKSGFEVIKVEHPSFPDALEIAPFFQSNQFKTPHSFYNSVNQGKKVVVLDYVKNDRAKFEELVKSSVGVIESFRPSASKKLGVDFETLRKINPSLCVLTIKGYPNNLSIDGVNYTEKAAHDLGVQALSGIIAVEGAPSSLPLTDIMAAAQGALKLTSAILATKSTPSEFDVPCPHVQVSMLESTLDTLGGILLHQNSGICKPGDAPCYDVYELGCGRKVSVSCLEEKFWTNFVCLIGLEHDTQILHEGRTAKGVMKETVQNKIRSSFQKMTWESDGKRILESDACVEPVMDPIVALKTLSMRNNATELTKNLIKARL